MVDSKQICLGKWQEMARQGLVIPQPPCIFQQETWLNYKVYLPLHVGNNSLVLSLQESTEGRNSFPTLGKEVVWLAV